MEVFLFFFVVVLGDRATTLAFKRQEYSSAKETTKQQIQKRFT
jgi:hypothetical protein